MMFGECRWPWAARFCLQGFFLFVCLGFLIIGGQFLLVFKWKQLNKMQWNRLRLGNENRIMNVFVEEKLRKCRKACKTIRPMREWFARRIANLNMHFEESKPIKIQTTKCSIFIFNPKKNCQLNNRRMRYVRICRCINALWGTRMTLVHFGWWTIMSLWNGAICHAVVHANMIHQPQAMTNRHNLNRKIISNYRIMRIHQMRINNSNSTSIQKRLLDRMAVVLVVVVVVVMVVVVVVPRQMSNTTTIIRMQCNQMQRISCKMSQRI